MVEWRCKGNKFPEIKTKVVSLNNKWWKKNVCVKYNKKKNEVPTFQSSKEIKNYFGFLQHSGIQSTLKNGMQTTLNQGYKKWHCKLPQKTHFTSLSLDCGEWKKVTMTFKNQKGDRDRGILFNKIASRVPLKQTQPTRTFFARWDVRFWKQNNWNFWQ